ncbi:hypothetical protein [Chryseobacterium potabilaquae]|uniref:Phage minor capsid protein 2 n=1 Tax=Chryseobacterium potabilaquae TaxID=2675057 RepID=A0A6N4XCI6_9FLAO|nr:hypothetical protein [Chryseobacterium potabilaquae]CAA7196743.1 hypothetical protein CHRY9293_02818 [Chryseobacterium potabilaquae]
MIFDDTLLREKELIDDKEVKKLENSLVALLIENISENINMVNRKLEFSNTTDSIVKKSLKKFYNTKVYRESLTKYLTKIEDISQLKRAAYQKKGLFIQSSEINPLQKLAIDEHLSYLNENGLNARFNQMLRKIIYSNIYAGRSQNQLEAELKNVISQKEALSKYIKQTLMQGADAYTSIIDQKITDKYIDNLTGYTMVGSLIESSSPQCRYCVEKLKRNIKKEDWKAVKEIASQNGLMEEAEFKNLPTHKLHYGCRHQFTPIIE